jgi:hypothetical protein
MRNSMRKCYPAVSLLEDLWDRPEIKPLLGPEMAKQHSKYVG